MICIVESHLLISEAPNSQFSILNFHSIYNESISKEFENCKLEIAKLPNGER